MGGSEIADCVAKGSFPARNSATRCMYNQLPMHESEPVNPSVEKTIALVFETFRGVTREGGVSWSESCEIDNYGTVDERQKARLRDKEPGWEALTNDPDWIPIPGVGGFNFVDPIGFRYYLPAAMIKNLRGQEMGHWELDIVLESSGEPDSFRLEMWSALQPAEIQCVCEFLKCMIAVERALTDPEPEWRKYSPNSWEEAYGSHWISLDANPVPIPPDF